MKWVIGGRYKIRYRLDNQRYDREGVASYMGVNLFGNYSFSGRPVFGTTELRKTDIISAEKVSVNTEPYMDRRAPTA